ncbi:MAG: thiosulfate oxidation carrier protein SoxY [Gammaproteobacteria bacterium]|uniref:Thiosulfate oxidation carrier protein SoxY n=1 Tax=Candidatus Thiopontia autotrophica TaxID=2841688 RepID=A0A8J6P4H5_9GAMM|nr:thiosulfate oxidation carrier protein SoxY [Candidatus Thiopontia autotrophica]MBL6968853.1 thiosulfate oxidation carrier protein SoxY [Gammaproteobacteria bacterium]
MKRRLFMKGTLAGSAVAAALGAGLLTPRTVLAAWPKAAMESSDAGDTGTPSNTVKIKAPEVAENGAVVPVEVNATGVDGIIESISIVAAANGRPIAGVYHLGEGAVPFVSTRIKMGKTGDVYGVVKTASGTISNKTQVKVTAGGCG